MFKTFFIGLFSLVRRNMTMTIILIAFGTMLATWIFNPGNVMTWLFGEGHTKSNGELISYIGIVSGGIAVLGNLYENNKRNRNLERANFINEKAQVNTRFKDAAILLGSNETASILSGVYALHQVALELYRSEDQKGYIKVINDIFCAYLRESSELRLNEETGKEERFCAKHTIVIQTIIDVLFKNDDNIYKQYTSDLSRTVLNRINFKNARIENTYFNDSNLTSVYFDFSYFSEVVFSNGNLNNISFINTKQKNVKFNNTNFSIANFEDSNLTDVRFSESHLLNLSFKNSVFKNVRFFNTDEETISTAIVSFEGTRLEGCTYNEAIEKSLKLMRKSKKEANLNIGSDRN